MRNRNIFRLFLVLFLSLIALFGFGGLANAAVCVPQDAVPTTYKTVENPDYVPAVPESSHWVTIVDEEAYDEEVLVSEETTVKHDAVPPTTTVFPAVFVPAVTHVVNHPAVTHVVHHEAQTHTVKHDEIFHVEYEYTQWITGNTKWRDSPTWNGTGLGWFYTGNSRVVVDVECWTETIVDVPAWDETVTDSEAWDETVVDAEAYTIPGYEVLNEDGVDAWVETIPAVYTTVHHDAETHQELVVDSEGKDAIGDPTISVVDVLGSDAVVCAADPVVVTPPAEPITQVANAVEPTVNVVAQDEELAHTGSWWDRVAPYAFGFLAIGIVMLVVSVTARRWDKKHTHTL